MGGRGQVEQSRLSWLEAGSLDAALGVDAGVAEGVRRVVLLSDPGQTQEGTRVSASVYFPRGPFFRFPKNYARALKVLIFNQIQTSIFLAGCFPVGSNSFCALPSPLSFYSLLGRVQSDVLERHDFRKWRQTKGLRRPLNQHRWRYRGEAADDCEPVFSKLRSVTSFRVVRSQFCLAACVGQPHSELTARSEL
jgi:hypothetical protein